MFFLFWDKIKNSFLSISCFEMRNWKQKNKLIPTRIPGINNSCWSLRYRVLSFNWSGRDWIPVDCRFANEFQGELHCLRWDFAKGFAALSFHWQWKWFHNGCIDNDNNDPQCNCHNDRNAKQCQRATIPKLMVDTTGLATFVLRI